MDKIFFENFKITTNILDKKKLERSVWLGLLMILLYAADAVVAV